MNQNAYKGKYFALLLCTICCALQGCDNKSGFSTQNDKPVAVDESHPAAVRDVTDSPPPTVIGTVNSFISFPEGDSK